MPKSSRESSALQSTTQADSENVEGKQHKRIVKTPYTKRACISCHKAKVKCSHERPCTRCTSKGIQCVDYVPVQQQQTAASSSSGVQPTAATEGMIMVPFHSPFMFFNPAMMAGAGSAYHNFQNNMMMPSMMPSSSTLNQTNATSDDFLSSYSGATSPGFNMEHFHDGDDAMVMDSGYIPKANLSYYDPSSSNNGIQCIEEEPESFFKSQEEVDESIIAANQPELGAPTNNVMAGGTELQPYVPTLQNTPSGNTDVAHLVNLVCLVIQRQDMQSRDLKSLKDDIQELKNYIMGNKQVASKMSIIS